LTRDLATAISEDDPAPVVILPVGDKPFETCVSGKLKIPLRITQHGEFNSALKLKPLGVPGLDGMKEIDVDGKATNATVELNLAQQKVPPGEYDLIFHTQAQGKYRPAASKGKTNEIEKPRDVTILAYSKPVRLKVAAAPVIITESARTNSIHPGDKFEVPVTIERLFGFDDVVELSLTSPESLKGMKAGKASISKEKREGKFELQTPTNAAPGDYEFKLQAEIKFNDQKLKVDRKIPIHIAAAAVEPAKAQ
jgi:uncharacterized membrane protein